MNARISARTASCKTDFPLMVGTAMVAIAAISLRTTIMKPLVVFSSTPRGWASFHHRELGASAVNGTAAAHPVEATGGDVAIFVGATLAAIATKLSSSVDDVVWLLPFLSGPDQKINRLRAVQYVALMMCVAGVASGVAVAGDSIMDALVAEGQYWSSERILGLASGCLLSLYTLHLSREWFAERREARREAAEKEGGEEGAEGAERSRPGSAQVVDEAAVVAAEVKEEEVEVRHLDDEDAKEEIGGGNDDKDDKEEEEADAKHQEKTTAKRLAVVSILGSLDDCTVFISLLLGKTFSPPQLLIGVCLGSILVTFICFFASLFRPLVRVVESIPLFVIIAVFAVYTMMASLLAPVSITAIAAAAVNVTTNATTTAAMAITG